jgi:hypothetical protein
MRIPPVDGERPLDGVDHSGNGTQFSSFSRRPADNAKRSHIAQNDQRGEPYSR